MDVDATVRRRRGRPGSRRAAVAAAALGVTLPLAGCGLFSSGGTSPVVMTVTSASFTHDTMPGKFTCAGGRSLTPPIAWSGAPARTKSIALVLDDSDAPITPYVYWVVFDIGPGTSGLQEGQLPPGALEARSSSGAVGYDAPCPGSSGHSYRFTVYALNTVLKLPNGTSLQSAWRAIAAATIGRGRLPVEATS